MKRSVLLACLCVGAAVPVTGGEREAALAEMLRTEKEYASAAADRGVVAAYRHFALPDALLLRPGPVLGREWLEKQTDGSEVTYSWYPTLGYVAPALDMGFTVGQTEVRIGPGERDPVFVGAYATVWKRNADGEWRAFLDAGANAKPGTKLPAAGTPGAAVVPFTVAAAQQPTAVPAGERIETVVWEPFAESHLADRCAVFGNRAAYAAVGDQRLVIVRDREGVASGLVAALAVLERTPRITAVKPIDSELSRGGDYGFVYGSLQARGADGRAVSRYYVRAWERDASGVWRVLLDVIDEPPAQP